MKKVTSIAIGIILSIFLMVGCSTTDQKVEDTVASTQEDTMASTEEETIASTEEDQIPSTEGDQLESSKTEESKQIRVGALKGPTAMGMAALMTKDQEETDPVYNFSISAAIDEITTQLVKGDLDIAAVPANLAAVLYNNTEGKVKVMAINTLGVLDIVENGNSISSIEDLRGKTIYATGKGATPEYALNYILTSAGLIPGTDVTIEFKSEPAECVALLGEENVVAMLPQPFVTTAQMKDENIRIALNLTKEWDTVSEDSEQVSSLLTGVVVVRSDFLESSKEEVDRFLDGYQESIDDTNRDVEAASVMIESFDIVPAAVGVKAIPDCNIVFIDGQEMKEQLSGYLTVLLDQNPQAVGGKLPDDEFYYIR
ncbi:MAG TPA: ABC transporter substrate-binding protein [Candidatus Merdenecus merdavium]|nr:ABC transporter substrate-binding protein [Candidatus Merdenecus merdavium]